MGTKGHWHKETWAHMGTEGHGHKGTCKGLHGHKEMGTKRCGHKKTWVDAERGLKKKNKKKTGRLVLKRLPKNSYRLEQAGKCSCTR